MPRFPEPVASPRQWHEPGQIIIPSVNWPGLRTLYMKEVRRFFKVQLQTVWGPALNTLFFLAIFTLALGGGSRRVLGMPYTDFLAPGLIIMGMVQNSFANTSSSLLIGKIQGNIVDVLMPPLSSTELLVSYVAGAVTRGWLVGGAVFLAMLLWPGVHILPVAPLRILYFGTMGCAMLALLGILTGIWAEKFDHAATVTNFVIQPLTLMSGTFYAIDRLSGGFRAFSLGNPFFYTIDGFRSGFHRRCRGVAGGGRSLSAGAGGGALGLMLLGAAYGVEAEGLNAYNSALAGVPHDNHAAYARLRPVRGGAGAGRGTISVRRAGAQMAGFRLRHRCERARPRAPARHRRDPEAGRDADAHLQPVQGAGAGGLGGAAGGAHVCRHDVFQQFGR